MTRLTESAIEEFAIQLFEQLGYQYIYAPDIAPDGDRAERTRYDEVVLTDRLNIAVQRINPKIPEFAREQAVKEITRINSPEILTNNETFHRLLTEGVNVSYSHDNQERGDLVWLIDFANPENNDFIVANQFTVIENNQNKRPDLVLFVNGLPLVVIELKNPADENATIKTAYQQFDTYENTIPSLFTYNALLIISDGLEAKAGSLSANLTRFMAWKSSEGGNQKAGVIWHTQGSGKSLSMVFYTGKLVLSLDNPTVLVIADRNDLDDQLFDTFAASTQLLRQEPKQVENREHLKDLLRVASGGVIFSTIQKFQPEDGNVYEQLSNRRNIIVMVDEAHRSQYGFAAKTLDVKDGIGNITGKKVVYGFAKYLRDALPNATYTAKQKPDGACGCADSESA
ncbi:MAG: type I restriction endonuclease subunit R [Desulfamplus sp.]|nr:type I restriction endonuclease subunit R [Desulfamplus sp.]